MGLLQAIMIHDGGPGRASELALLSTRKQRPPAARPSWRLGLARGGKAHVGSRRPQGRWLPCDTALVTVAEAAAATLSLSSWPPHAAQGRNTEAARARGLP